MNRLIYIALSIVVLMVAVTGCVTIKPSPATTAPWVGTAPVIETFRSNPSTIVAGSTTTLTWKVTGATSVRIDPGIGMVAASGSRTISPAESTVYTIIAHNDAGTVTSTLVATVNSKSPVPVVFRVTSVTAGIEPSSYTNCYTLYADITANGPGTVTYIWESADGGGSWQMLPTQDMAFIEGGSTTAAQPGSGWYDQFTGYAPSPSGASVYGQSRVCQTFTASDSYYFNSVSL